jgi:hypothetical protein
VNGWHVLGGFVGAIFTFIVLFALNIWRVTRKAKRLGWKHPITRKEMQ